MMMITTLAVQMDDDSFILGPVGRDMVAELDVAGAVMAARGTGPDPVLVLWGLAGGYDVGRRTAGGSVCMCGAGGWGGPPGELGGE